MRKFEVIIIKKDQTLVMETCEAENPGLALLETANSLYINLDTVSALFVTTKT